MANPINDEWVTVDLSQISRDLPDEWEDVWTDMPVEKAIGYFEAVGQDIPAKIPFSPIPVIETMGLVQAGRRLQRDDYQVSFFLPEQEGLLPSDIGYIPPERRPALLKQQRDFDIDLLTKHFEEEEERSRRGYATMGRVGQITSAMPAYITEFVMTGGLQKLGTETAKRGATALLRRHAATTAGKAAIATGGFAVGTGLRAAGMPHRAANAILKRQIPQDIEISGDGDVKITGPVESSFTSIWKGLADHYIEIASEQAGEYIAPVISGGFKRLPFMGKLMSMVRTRWLKLNPGKTISDFTKKVGTTSGFHGTLSEIGEEYLGDITRAITDVEDFGANAIAQEKYGRDANMSERIAAGVGADTENFPAMFISFVIPGAAVGIANVAVTKQQAENKKRQNVLDIAAGIEINTPTQIATAEGTIGYEDDFFVEKWEEARPKYDFDTPGIGKVFTPKWLLNRMLGAETLLEDVDNAFLASSLEQQHLNTWIGKLTKKLKKEKGLARLPEILPAEAEKEMRVQPEEVITEEMGKIPTPQKIKPEQITKTAWNTYDADLPSVKEGYIRLFRGQHPDQKDLFHEKRGVLTDKEIQELGLSQGKGGWFSPWLNYAVNYAEAQGKGWEVVYMDVLRSVADTHIAEEAPAGLAEEGEAAEYYFPELREAPAEAKLVPTKAHILQKKIDSTKPIHIMRDLLDTYEDAPAFLNKNETKIFNQVRELTRYLRQRVNLVREKMGLEPIREVEGYITHWMDSVANRVVNKDLPIQSGYLYFLMRGLPKEVKNPTAEKRRVKGMMEKYFSKDLGKLLKIMTAYDLRDIYLMQPYQAAWDELQGLRRDRLIPDSTYNEIEKYLLYDIRKHQAPADKMFNKTMEKPVDFLGKLFHSKKIIDDPARSVFSIMRRLGHLSGLGFRMKPAIRNLGQQLLLLDLYRTKDYAKAKAAAIRLADMPNTEHPITGEQVPVIDLVREQDWYKMALRKFEDITGVVTGVERGAMYLYGKTHIGNLFLSNVEVSALTGYFDWENNHKQSMDHKSPHFKNILKEAKRLGIPFQELQTQKNDMMWNIREAVRRTQWEYFSISMPTFYRSQFNRAMGQFQSWWMNYFFNHGREMINQIVTGRNSLGRLLTPYGRLRALKGMGTIQAIARTTESILGIEMLKYLFIPLPGYLPPIPALIAGILQYFAASDDRQKKVAMKKIKRGLKFWIPFSAFARDFNKMISGEFSISDFLLYKKPEK